MHEATERVGRNNPLLSNCFKSAKALTVKWYLLRNCTLFEAPIAPKLLCIKSWSFTDSNAPLTPVLDVILRVDSENIFIMLKARCVGKEVKCNPLVNFILIANFLAKSGLSDSNVKLEVIVD
jgi:hypothetical protein